MAYADAFPACDTDLVPNALAPDRDDDTPIVLTRRRLLRVVIVACEAGARLAGDASGVDPVAWMLAPRRLHSGVAPIDACQALEECERATLLLGLGLGLDADRASFDALLADEPGLAPRELEAA